MERGRVKTLFNSVKYSTIKHVIGLITILYIHYFCLLNFQALPSLTSQSNWKLALNFFKPVVI